MDALLDEIYYNGPVKFQASRLADEEKLFAMRGALFYTPTSRIPGQWIGRGRLDVWLPVAIPTIQEYADCPSRQSVRLWVDLLQRATGKIRWVPNLPARVRFIRTDSVRHSPHNLCVKSLLDALKASTGRRDRRLLYYFGAISDDNNDDLLDGETTQELVDSPAKGGTRVIVEQIDQEEAASVRASRGY
jgi:hypothetical protein